MGVGTSILAGTPLAPVDHEVHRLVEKLRRSVSEGELKIVRVELNRLFDREAELIEPLNLLRNPNTEEKYQRYVSAIASCERNRVPKGYADAQAVKLLTEFKIHCEKYSPPDRLWREPPFLHPLGGSWLKHLNTEYGVEITPHDKRYLHAGEDLQLGSPEVLSALLKRDQVIWDGDSLLFHLETAGPVAIFADLATNDPVLAGLPYRFVPEFGPSCAQIESTGRWIVTVPWWRRQQMTLLYVFTGLLTLSIIGLIAVLWVERRQAEAMRTISALAISHELRHPVSTMSLLLDSWREDYDQLSEQKKGQFLSLANELRRLRSLVRATETFLRRGPSEAIRWQVSRVESLATWGGTLAQSYGVEFENRGSDGPFRTDTYWLGVAVENLIKNALKHGQSPVRVVFNLEAQKRRLHIRLLHK